MWHHRPIRSFLNDTRRTTKITGITTLTAGKATLTVGEIGIEEC